MPVLRLILAGLIALMAMVAVLVTASVVFFTGLAAFVVQLFRPRRTVPAPPRSPVPHTGEVIDVVATKVPNDPTEQ